MHTTGALVGIQAFQKNEVFAYFGFMKRKMGVCEITLSHLSACANYQIITNFGKTKNMKDNVLGIVIRDIPIGEIDENVGQIPDVPKNPRKITPEKFKALCDSIERSPEMKEISEVLVYPYEGRYVVISGNHRARAYKRLKWELVRCKVLPEDTPREKIREYVIKENKQYATDDEKLLASWDIKELAAWDVPMKLAGRGTADSGVGEVEFTKILDESHNYIVLYFDSDVDWLQAQTLFGVEQVKLLSTARGRENKNGFKYGVGRVFRGADIINRLMNLKGVGSISEGNSDEDIS